MAKAVKVSPVDVQRAKLLVRLNQALGTTSPTYVRKIADARPAPRSSSNGSSPGPSPTP